MSAEFFDTNVILYLLDHGEKANTAERLLSRGGVVSVQVLNETLVNCIRKGGMTWEEAGEFLSGIRRLCRVVDVTSEIHDVGRAVGERYGFSVYDAMIVAAALVAGCSVLYSEDMQDGMVVGEDLRIVDPFAGRQSVGLEP